MSIDSDWRNMTNVRLTSCVIFRHRSIDIKWRQLTWRVSDDVFWRYLTFLDVIWCFLTNLNFFLAIIDEIWRKRQFYLTSFDFNYRQLTSIDVNRRQFSSTESIFINWVPISVLWLNQIKSFFSENTNASPSHVRAKREKSKP